MKKIIIASVLICVLLPLIVVTFITKTLATLPSISEYNFSPKLSSKILDDTGDVFSEFFIEQRTFIPIQNMPQILINALLAIEDSNFRSHFGVDFKGLFRAMFINIKAGRVVQGASTLTQQLSKLIFLTTEKTFTRKFKELLLAIQLEYRFSKDEILQMYLNQVYFGKGIYGIHSISKRIFNKNVKDLTLAECALIAGIPKRPNYYSPLKNLEHAMKRRDVVLQRMLELGYISERAYNLAIQKKMNIQIEDDANRGIGNYFSEYIRKKIKKKYGDEILYNAGLTIHTTINSRLQTISENIISDFVSEFNENFGQEAHLIRRENALKDILQIDTIPEECNVIFSDEYIQVSSSVQTSLISEMLQSEEILQYRKISSDTDPSLQSKYDILFSSGPILGIQCALIILDTKNGHIKSLVGGSDFSVSEFNRAVQSKRPPGSIFKPFVWASALKDGEYQNNTIIDDSFLAFKKNEEEDWVEVRGRKERYELHQATEYDIEQIWIPKNYNKKFYGPITFRRGLELSRNVIAVKLIHDIGPPSVIELSHQFGMQYNFPPVLSLSLGSSGLTLLDITTAYSVFSTGGIYKNMIDIIKVVDTKGITIDEYTVHSKQVYPVQLAYLMTSLLQGVIKRGTGWRAKKIKYPIAGKTGTSQKHRDVWFIGYTPSITCGIWIGYDDFSSIGRNLGASQVVVPIWKKIMERVLQFYPHENFIIPKNIIFKSIDASTGYLSLPSCPSKIIEAFISFTEPKEFCPFH